MAQIQKEEEARKKKLAAAAATAQAAVIGSVPSPVGGKSYANLAGKVSSPATNPVGGAWTTVGAGGKPRTPSGPPAPTTTRTVSSGIVPTAQPTAKKLPTRSSTMASPGGVNAQEEFRKWAVGELRPDLNKGIPGKTKPTARRQFGLY
jgi:PERQ amino acid-rich with GYF domain-containing protein